MVQFIDIGGALTAIPDVYSTFKVQNSLPAPVPAGRSVLILGESTEGVPGADLDLRAVQYTSFTDVKDQYGSGSIVDAARMLFSNQPSGVFTGAISALYVYKTNSTTRASKAIASPANYGDIVAARYGEPGNNIKTQIKTGQAESKPTKTFAYLPSLTSKTYKVSVNGAVTASSALLAKATADAFVAAWSVSGLSVTGGAVRTVLSLAATVDVTASGDQLTITRTAGGNFSTTIQAGDSCFIDAGLTISGALDVNAGSYLVVSVSTTVLVLKQIKGLDVNAAALDGTITGAALGLTDIKINGPVTMTVTATTADGAGASLEVLETAASPNGLSLLYKDSDVASMITSGTSSVAKVSASVPAAGQLTITMTGGSFSVTPKIGDLVKIPRGSLLAGATQKNVGLLVVTSANSQSITCKHLVAGMTTEAVSQVSLNGSTTAVQYLPTFVSTDVSARKMNSAAEKKMQMIASRSTDGASFPNTLIGGNVVLEVGYWLSGVTACTLSIDSTKTLTITPVGGGSEISLKLGKYATLADLVDFLNTQSGVYAKTADSRYNVFNPKDLDQVTSVGILSGHSLSAYNGRIKKDYYDWKDFFAKNSALIAFKEGTMVLKVGLPAAESQASFLSGGSIGSTSNASILAGLEQALNIDVRIVLPLFSRDAQYDIEDGLTDEDSSYTINSINENLKAHVATASSDVYGLFRFGYASFDGSFEDAQLAASGMGYERIKMGFMRHAATNASGDSVNFLPWMEMASIAAGRVQSRIATSMLNKSFLLSSAYHIGQQSLFSDTLTQDFVPSNRGQKEAAITAGLVVMEPVTGTGIVMTSPDLTSRSKINDPQGWVWERENVLFACDDFRTAARLVLRPFIGERTTDVSTAVVENAVNNLINSYISSGTFSAGEVTEIKNLGNGYKVFVKIFPAEALEYITLDVTAERSV